MSTPISDLVGFILQGSLAVVSSSDTHALTPADECLLRQQLTTADRLARLHAPGQPPSLCFTSACWAAQTMHFLCRTLLDRVETITDLPPDLVAAQPTGTRPAQHWSVDLVFRVLADVDKRCAGANQLDPLQQTIAMLAFRWPMSAIGIQGDLCPDATAVVVSDSTLCRIAVDRIVSRHDSMRANLPCFAEHIATTGLRPLA